MPPMNVNRAIAALTARGQVEPRVDVSNRRRKPAWLKANDSNPAVPTQRERNPKATDRASVRRGEYCPTCWNKTGSAALS
jgi:hypothetical protein